MPSSTGAEKEREGGKRNGERRVHQIYIPTKCSFNLNSILKTQHPDSTMLEAGAVTWTSGAHKYHRYPADICNRYPINYINNTECRSKSLSFSWLTLTYWRFCCTGFSMVFSEYSAIIHIDITIYIFTISHFSPSAFRIFFLSLASVFWLLH